MPRVFAYLRVSTDKQGVSGLGLEAQREAVRTYCRFIGAEIAGEFVEVESGRNDDRPALAEALAACRREKARLVIAKLDRLSRRVSFIAKFMETGVDFIACDMPHADRFRLHIEAAIAEEEAAKISARTKAALAAAKARGVKLGNPHGRVFSGAERAAGTAAAKARADERAQDVLPVLKTLTGLSLAAMAAELNRRGVQTARGGAWKPEQVRRVLARG